MTWRNGHASQLLSDSASQPGNNPSETHGGEMTWGDLRNKATILQTPQKSQQ